MRSQSWMSDDSGDRDDLEADDLWVEARVTCEICGRGQDVAPVQPRYNPSELVLLCGECRSWAE